LSNMFLDVMEFPKRIKYLTVTTDIMMFVRHIRS
jgi:hypothetical protein